MVRPTLVGTALLALLAAPAAQELSSGPVVDRETRQSRAEFVRSRSFREQGLRCGTTDPQPKPGFFLRQRPSHCSLQRTIIRQEYEPEQGLLEIPVVFHVLRTATGYGNVTAPQIRRQIDVLNEDYGALAGSLGENGTDAMIRFYLAEVDPDGNPTGGITKHKNDDWYRDGGNYWEELAWDPERYLNIYTNNASGYLGYVPGLPQEGAAGETYDRVVLLWSTVGRDTPFGPPFDQGRTATHEVGHYLGLFHTFSGGCAPVANCYRNGDRICDTNPEVRPALGCPQGRTTCNSVDPIENYMDYSDDRCLEEFSAEQINRMRCTIVNWRPNLARPRCDQAAVAYRHEDLNLEGFTATPAVIGGTVQFTLDTHCYWFGTIYGAAEPARYLLEGGWALIDLESPSLFTLGPFPGQFVEASLPIAPDPSMCGMVIYTQGMALDGDGPYQLTNAIDLTIGI